MADLKKTQAKWTDFFREFFTYIHPYKILREIQEKFLFQKTRVLELNEGANVVSAWTFVGARRGDNCSEGGRLFIKLNDETPGAAQAQIQVYSDSARTALVAQGDAADGAAVTLAEQNNSGLSGTALLGTVAASNLTIELLLDLDEELKGTRAFGISDGSTAAGRSFKITLASIESTLRSLVSARRAEIELNFIATRMREFLGSAEPTVISFLETADATTGDIDVTVAGILDELDDAMKDETTAAVQTVLENTVTVGTPAFDLDNVGKGALVTVATREYARNGTITFKCTAGKDTTLQEQFTPTMLDEDALSLTASQFLTISEIWETFRIGVRLRLDRLIVDANDGGAQLDTWVIVGETLTNTNVGVLYVKYFDIAGTRTVELYNATTRAAAELVATGSKIGDGVITLVEANDSGLSGSVNATFAVDDVDIEVDLQAFAVGDKIRVVITNDEAGRLQTLTKDLWNFKLNSAAAGAETLPDTLVEEGVDHVLNVS